MARSRYGRKSNIGKKLYPWTEQVGELNVDYAENMKKAEFITGTLHKADSTTDVNTYLFIAKSLKIDLGDSTEFTEIRNKVWDVYKDLPTTDINRLYDLFNPSYDK